MLVLFIMLLGFLNAPGSSSHDVSSNKIYARIPTVIKGSIFPDGQSTLTYPAQKVHEDLDVGISYSRGWLSDDATQKIYGNLKTNLNKPLQSKSGGS